MACLSMVFLLPSCGKTPIPCFTISVDKDSVRVGQPVTFNASCSQFAGDYDWILYNNNDSIFFGKILTRTFYDTGHVSVFLQVVATNNTSSTTQVIYVNP